MEDAYKTSFGLKAENIDRSKVFGIGEMEFEMVAYKIFPLKLAVIVNVQLGFSTAAFVLG